VFLYESVPVVRVILVLLLRYGHRRGVPRLGFARKEVAPLCSWVYGRRAADGYCLQYWKLYFRRNVRIV